MKFSHSLQLNAAPEWHDKYIAYPNLKKLIYRMERAHLVGIPASAISKSNTANVPLASLQGDYFGSRQQSAQPVATPGVHATDATDNGNGAGGSEELGPASASVLDLQKYLQRSEERDRRVAAMKSKSTGQKPAGEPGKGKEAVRSGFPRYRDTEDSDTDGGVVFDRDDQDFQGRSSATLDDNQHTRSNESSDFGRTMEPNGHKMVPLGATKDTLIDIGDESERLLEPSEKHMEANSHVAANRLLEPDSENSSVYMHSRSNTVDPPVKGGERPSEEMRRSPSPLHVAIQDEEKSRSSVTNATARRAHSLNLNGINNNINPITPGGSGSEFFSPRDPFDTSSRLQDQLANNIGSAFRSYSNGNNENSVRNIDGAMTPGEPNGNNVKVDVGVCITMFTEFLDKELYRTTQFYIQQEAKILARYDQMIQQLRKIEYEYAIRHGYESNALAPFPLLKVMDPEPSMNIGITGNGSRNFAGSVTNADSTLYGSSMGSGTISTSQTPVGIYSQSFNSTFNSAHEGASNVNSNHKSGSNGRIGRSGRSKEAYLPGKIWGSKELKQQRLSVSRKLSQLFVSLIELKDFCDLNYTGFSKILKKFDKVMGVDTREDYIEQRVEEAEPYQHETKERLQRAQNLVVAVYARINYEGKINIASTALRHSLREHIVWERNTVWRDMVDQERRTETIGVKDRVAGLGPVFNRRTKISIRLDPDSPPVFAIAEYRPFRGSSLWLPYMNRTLFMWTCTVFVFIYILSYEFTSIDTQQQRCLAILVVASILWATELLPLFITSAMIPGLIVLLKVLKAPDGSKMDAKATAKKIFSDMFGPVIMLLLGGFSLASVLSKHNIARKMAGVILEKVGSRPRDVILANMLVSTFLSMWISNVATPVLCFSLVQPILRVLPSNSNYAKCLILGIALAANVGGMASPIASPQNVVAVGFMNPAPSWIQWFTVSIPTVFIIDVCIWLLLLLIFRPAQSTNQDLGYTAIGGNSNEEEFTEDYFNVHPVGGEANEVLGQPPASPNRRSVSPGVSNITQRKDGPGGFIGSDNEQHVGSQGKKPLIAPPELFSRHRGKTFEPLTGTQIFIVAVCVVTILLWCIESKFDYVFGDMGVIAILPIVVFYGAGLLTKDDWNSMLWSVVMLAMGGIALGKAVESSGLLATIVDLIKPHINDLSPFVCLLALSFVTLIVTTFISHTVGALILLPVVQAIGKSTGQANIMVMAVAFMCSGGMGLPVSSFPNMNAISQVDHRGKQWLTVRDFLITGVPASIVTWLVVSTVSYVLMTSVGIN